VNDFLITMITLYPWSGWLLAVLAGVGLGCGSLVVAWGIGLVADWGAYRRLVWRSKSAVRKAILDADCPVCKVFEGEPADDPPWYRHPGDDPDDNGPGDDDDWPDDDPPGRMAGLAEVLRRASEAGLLDDDQLPDDDVPRCNDRDCDQYGFVHPPPCRLMPTMPAACYTDETIAQASDGVIPPETTKGRHGK
jgi:hypothetical protein